MKRKLEPFSLRLRTDQLVELQRIAQDQGISVSELIRWILDEIYPCGPVKPTALDSDQTMSEDLRQAVDRYLILEETDLRLSKAQRAVIKDLLREGLSMHPEHIAKVLAALESGSDSGNDE